MKSKLIAALAGAILVAGISIGFNAQAVEVTDQTLAARVAAMPTNVHAQWRGHHRGWRGHPGWHGGPRWGHRRVVVHHGHGWGHRPHWGPRRVVYGHGWGHRPHWNRPTFYRPVIVAGAGWCRWERRVRWSWRFQTYVVRRVQVCY